MSISTVGRRPRLRALADLGDLPPGRLAIVLNLPSLLFVAGIILYPIVYALWVSFHSVGTAELRSGAMPFVGLANFAGTLTDPIFALSLQHTLVFVLVSVVLEIGLGLSVALVVNRPSRLARVARVMVLLPWAVPPIINGLVWSFIYSAKYGYLNAVLWRLGLITEYVNWTGNEKYALLAAIVPYVWRTTPFAVLILHAALQGIPEELYEAAEIDGASLMQRFRHVTLPLLQPAILVLLVLRTAFAFMVFDEIFALTNGGPGNSTWVASWYAYTYAFRYFDMGRGAAASYVLTLIIGLVALLYIRLLYRRPSEV